MADQNVSISIMEVKPLHPLHQIAQTPSHKLLLKQWLKEAELILNRIALKENQIDSVSKEIDLLCCLFGLFYVFSWPVFLTSHRMNPPPQSCSRSWIIWGLCFLSFSFGIIWAVRYKTDVKSHLEKLLEREKEDSKLLEMCVEELKQKGADFDLLKEVDALRRAKSLRVEAKAVSRKWSTKNLLTLCIFAYTAIMLALTRKLLCN